MARKDGPAAAQESQQSQQIHGNNSKGSPRNGHRKGRKSTTNNDSYFSTDPNFKAFRARLLAIGLALRDIEGDGNCLFRALGDQLNGTDCDHLKHREDVVSYMTKHENDFAPFVEDDVPFTKHINELRQPGTFAGNDAIVAFARLHNVNVIIHQLDAPVIEIKGTDNPGVRQLHISYHNGDHYSSVRRANDSTNNPVNIRLKTSGNKLKSSTKPSTSKSPSLEFENEFSDLISAVKENSGCDDSELVKTSLLDNNYDVQSTIDAVKATLVLTQSDSEDENLKNENTSTTLKPKSRRSHELRAKKADKKSRRMRERREQILMSKGVTTTSTLDTSLINTSNGQHSEVVNISSSQLDIVSV